MGKDDAVVAVFADCAAADAAIKKLAVTGFALKHFNLVGKGYHTAEEERARAMLGVINPKQIEMHLMAPALSKARQAATV